MMQRRSEKIEVAFGSKGSQELKRDLRSIGGAIGEMKTKAAGAVQTVATFGAGFGAAAAAWTAGMGAIALSNNDYIDSIARLSNVTGTGLDEMSRLAGVARRFGVDVDDLRGSMVQFFGQAAAGARGDSIAEEFEKIGISSQFLADNLDDPIKILLAVAKAQKQLSGASRTGVLSVLFGEDDSVKVGELLNALGSDSQAVADALNEIEASGAIVSQRDVDTTREYNASLAEFSDVFQGLRLELGRGILPILSKLTGATAGFIRENRAVISGTLLGGWERVSYVIQDIIDYLEGGRNAVQGSWLYSVTGWMEDIANAGGTASRIMGELFDELSGNRRTREFQWVDGLAAGLRTLGGLSAAAIDGAFAVVGSTAMGSLELLNHLPGAIAVVQDAWAEFAKGFSGTVTGTGLAELGGLFGDIVGWSIELKDALADIAAGQPVDAQFQWVQDLVDSAPDLIAAIREMGDISGVLGAIGENFDTIAASAVPLAAAGALILSTLGGVGVFAASAAVALGVLIAKLSETHTWLRAPFEGADWLIKQMIGMNDAEQQMYDAMRSTGENAYEEWRKQLPEGDFRKTLGLDDLGSLPEIPVTIAPQLDVADIERLIADAQLELSGAISMSQFPDQITAATAATSNVTRAAAALPAAAPTGVPIVVQLTAGQSVTLYAEDQDVATKLLDLIAEAERATATPGGLPFARPKP